MASFIDSLITIENSLIEVVLDPQEGREYYVTAWTRKFDHFPKNRYFTNCNSQTFSPIGKYLRHAENGDYAVFLNSHGEEVSVVCAAKTAFYPVETTTELSQLKIAEKVEVILNAQENRHYCVTDFSEIVNKDTEHMRYCSTNPLIYVGKHTGYRIEGWGKDMKEWSHFINEQGKEVIITHTETTAFYHTPFCVACNKVGHRIHTCPNDKKREAYYAAQKPKPVKELKVIRTPIEGKFYEATFWTRKEGHWSKETHYTLETTPREYAGQYLRHKREGYGDGADHWAIFLKNGKEIEIEYDYDGNRAWYEVEPQ
jgi:hypothetical protein